MSLPAPVGTDWRKWANALVAHFNRQVAQQEPTDPRPVQLAYWDNTKKATQAGILMFDPVTDKVKVSTTAKTWVDLN